MQDIRLPYIFRIFNRLNWNGGTYSNSFKSQNLSKSGASALRYSENSKQHVALQLFVKSGNAQQIQDINITIFRILAKISQNGRILTPTQLFWNALANARAIYFKFGMKIGIRNGTNDTTQLFCKSLEIFANARTSAYHIFQFWWKLRGNPPTIYICRILPENLNWQIFWHHILKLFCKSRKILAKTGHRPPYISNFSENWSKRQEFWRPTQLF